MLRIIKFLIYCVVLAVAAGFIYFYFKSPAKADVETGKARINEIESMVRLCAVDIYSEIPVLDTINDKVIFGIQKQSGSISFDLEKLNADTLGDTVRIILPPEIVELYESTEDNSWEVIDTKNIGLLGVLRSDKLTDREENIVKAEIKEKANASFKKEVENNPVFKKRLTDTAERKARAYFENLFASRGYHAEVVFGK